PGQRPGHEEPARPHRRSAYRAMAAPVPPRQGAIPPTGDPLRRARPPPRHRPRRGIGLSRRDRWKAWTGRPPPGYTHAPAGARGPVHEAFAPLAADPEPTKSIAKRPPAPIEELPPDDKPNGAVIWISGYWAFDDERNDFLWVSGTWRAPPPGKQWVAGYWRED